MLAPSRWLLVVVGAAPVLTGCSALGAGFVSGVADQSVAMACNSAEASLGEAIDRRQWAEARSQLQRMRSTCQPHRYRAAQQYLDEMNPPVAQQPRAPVRTGTNTFPACMAHVEDVGLPPWDSRFSAMVDPKTCSSEDLDDAEAVLRHKLEQRCRQTGSDVRARLSAGDVDGARAAVNGAELHCEATQLAALRREVEGAAATPTAR